MGANDTSETTETVETETEWTELVWVQGFGWVERKVSA